MMTRFLKWLERSFRRMADRLNRITTQGAGPGGGPGGIDR